MLQRAFLCIVLELFFFSGYGQVVSDFNSNADGWTVFDRAVGSSSAVTYNSGGGNPTGNISFSTASANAQFYFNAPAKFIGNLGFSYNQNLSFDLQQSATGNDNSVGDVILANTAAGASIFFQLAAKPAIGSWSSYSAPLKETAGWHFGSPAGPAPTKDQMKQVLVNVTAFQIRLKYSTAAGAYTGLLDNVVLNVAALGTPPVISSFTPTSGLKGTSVTINGTNFNPAALQNAVYFNGIQAVVTSASATQLVANVPVSAPYGPITVADVSTGLQGASKQSFNLLFDNNKDYGGRIIPASMTRGYATLLPMSNNVNTFGAIDKADFDGDGWVDLVVTETGTQTIFVSRNLGTGGVVSVASFGALTALPSLSGVPGGSPSLSRLLVADFDSDGKLDVAALCQGASYEYFSLFKNTTSAPGTISFNAPQFFPIPNYNAYTLAASDLDGDGRIDLLATSGTVPSNLWIAQNISSPGNIDFAFGQTFGANTGFTSIAADDLDGDLKPDVVMGNANNKTFSILKNTSTPGTISLAASFIVTPDVSTGSNPIMRIMDLDNDGKLDLAWSTSGASTVYLKQNIYAGGAFDATAFSADIPITSHLSSPLDLSGSDINSDGKMDLVAVGATDISIFQNVGASGVLSVNSFMPGTMIQGTSSGVLIGLLGPVVADLDGDSKPEVAILSSGNGAGPAAVGIYIFHNESYPVPIISSESPTSGTIGTSVSLNGDLMNTGNATPSVRLGNLLATVTSASNTLTSAMVKPGSASNRFNVTLHGLTGFSKPYPISFPTDRTITSSSFGPSINFALANGLRDALAIADFDDDGKPDVAVVDNSFTAKIFQNSATAGTSITTSSLSLLGTTFTSGYNVAALDIDGDGKTDLNSGFGLLQSNGTPGSISFLGGPNGVSTSAGGFNGVASSDFNKDGKVDLAVTNGTANVQVYENQSNVGKFTNNGFLSTFSTTAVNLAKPNNYGGVIAVDLDGDGYDDISSTSSTANNFTYYRNLAQYGSITATSFASGVNVVTGKQPYSLIAADFDGDGKQDIAVTHFNDLFVSVYRNTSTLGSISFASRVDFACPNNGYNLAAQDLDGDGKAEIVVMHQPNPPPGSFSIFQNTSTSGNISFASVVNFPITHNPQAIAIADINLDQKPDILIVASPYIVAGNFLMVFENKLATLVITINTQPLDAIVCTGATATFTTAASGTTNITYQWQFATTSAGPFVDISNGGGYSGASTSTLSVNTTGNFGAGRYRCKISGDFAASVLTTDEGLFINALPAAPTAAGASSCGSGSLSLTASGGSNGNYRWYSVATGGTALAGEVNSIYSTPVLTISTMYYVTIISGSCESSRTSVLADIKNIPAAPSATGASNCGPGSLSVTASGGTNGNYRWYTVAIGGTAIAGEVNSTYSTPVINAPTTYYVSVVSGSCEGSRTAVLADVKNVPAAPSATGATACAPASVTLDASGGSNGQYRWYTVISAGTAISGEVNDTYLTPLLSSATTFYVAINDGFCESTRTPVVVDVQNCPNNQPPVISPGPESTAIGGQVTIDLATITSDPDNNLDLSTLIIVQQPFSGAVASLDANHVLSINYQGVAFSGLDKMIIQVCDQAGACAQKEIDIQVSGNITVYNAVSPNGDGKNDGFILEFIDILPSTQNNHVTIYNRWGDAVFDINDYNNTSRLFAGVSSEGKSLPSGTYFYKAVFTSGAKPLTGYLELKR